MKPIQFLSEVEIELVEAADWYESQREGLGREFREEIELAIEKIRSNPAIGATYPQTDQQFVLVRRFPYLICYLDLESMIWITAVAHERRRPGYWFHRKPD